MPLYSFICSEGHSTERLAPRETELIFCSCGQPAARESVYAIGVSGFARTPIDQRPIKLRAFQEASAELEYNHSRRTNVDGSPSKEPSLWKAAKHEANRLLKLGVKDSGDL